MVSSFEFCNLFRLFRHSTENTAGTNTPRATKKINLSENWILALDLHHKVCLCPLSRWPNATHRLTLNIRTYKIRAMQLRVSYKVSGVRLQPFDSIQRPINNSFSRNSWLPEAIDFLRVATIFGKCVLPSDKCITVSATHIHKGSARNNDKTTMSCTTFSNQIELKSKRELKFSIGMHSSQMMNWIFSTSFSIEFGATIQSLFDIVALTNNWLFDKRTNTRYLAAPVHFLLHYYHLVAFGTRNDVYFSKATASKFIVLARILFVPSTLCAVAQNTAIISEKSWKYLQCPKRRQHYTEISEEFGAAFYCWNFTSHDNGL